ncbi:MAG: PAS domain-containing protein [bacterium]
MKKNYKPETIILRQKAEEFMTHEPSKISSQLSKVEAILIHELEVHQIELEMQNEELVRAKERAVTATEKYEELYDFAPSGYFTLSATGEILELNLTGANMLGKARSNLKNSKFGFFVSDDTRSTFNQFLESVFNSGTKATCEVMLAVNGSLPVNVFLTGIESDKGEQCFVNVVDITSVNRNKSS